METKIPFKLYAHCIPVKGATRSTICDLHKGNIHFIPNELYDILTSFNGQPIQNIMDTYSEDDKETIIEYFSYLLEKKLLFLTKYPELFPPLNTQYHYPGMITNAIIDINVNIRFPWIKIADDLTSMGCQHLQIRGYEIININYYENIFSSFMNSSIRSIEAIIKFSPEFADNRLISLCDKFPVISNLIIHSSPGKRSLDKMNIHYIREEISGVDSCGNILPEYFSINTATFTEALHYNSCLNGKISIDKNGYIKNCPSCTKSFGHIMNDSLISALTTEFKRPWAITKDQISICKDCEFRYICTDCRAYIMDNADEFSKPQKCGYNPYTCTWSS